MSLNGGYAMIKYNSTQEELQIAYRSKKPALFYDENQRAHWAVIEETATESVDEETQEPITTYEYSYKLLNDIEALVDSNGNNRFIGGEGISTANEELTFFSIKWALNGNNLIFEISGLTNIEIINTKMKICEFTLPKFITDKINALNGFVDLTQGIAADSESVFYPLYLSVEKLDNSISFFLIVNETLNANYIFTIKYSIINNE